MEGDQPYLLNDGAASSSSIDGSVPNTDSLIDAPSSDNPPFGINGGSVPPTGSISDHIDPSVDGLPKEADALVPDGSSTTKIKKPRRSEEFDYEFILHANLIHLCMLLSGARHYCVFIAQPKNTQCQCY